MEQTILNFTANGQMLTQSGGTHLASDTINYIGAVFDLQNNWDSFDSVRAVWFNDFNTISTLLDSNGTCTVPMEVMKRKGKVYVNLVGSVSENDVVTDRLTTYPINAITIDAKAMVSGSETSEITASQFEQYVAQVTALVASVKDIESTVLNDDYTLTINFSDGTSTTVGPIRGAQGEQGIQGETGATGATGATGNGISSIAKTGTSGLVDTYTITFTDGSTTTFTVTNGAKGADGSLASGVLAPTYSSSATYAVGDYVYYSGSLYRCTTAITTAESWTSGHWTQVALAPEVTDLKDDIDELADALIDGRDYKSYLKYTYTQGVVHSRAYNDPIIDSITCYSPLYPIADEDLLINIATGFKALIVYFASESDASPTTSLWLTGDNTVAKADAPSGKYYFAIEIRRSDSSSLAPSDANGKTTAYYNKSFDYYNKEETDSKFLPIEQYLGMASSSAEIDLSYVRQQSNTRIYSWDLDEAHELAFVKSVSAVAPTGFYVSISAWNGVPGEGVATAWGASASYSNDNTWTYFQIVAKKTDDSAISDAEFSTFKSNISVTIERETLNSGKYVFVSTGGSDSTGNGTSSKPFKTVGKALTVSNNIVISAGTYNESLAITNRNNISIIASRDKTNNDDKVIISTTSTNALQVINCNKVYLDGIIFDGANVDVVVFNKCSDVEIQNCEFNNSTTSNGVNLNKTDAVIRSCRANNNSNDGFNMHYYGDTHFYNCSGSGNGGDGLSHHEECTGTVIGGYWDNNGKAGISTPTYGAKVNISDAIVSNNVHGMQVYGGDDVTENTVHIKVSNVVFLNNSADGIQVDKYIVDLVNCVFSGNTTDTNIVSGTINQYNC